MLKCIDCPCYYRDHPDIEWSGISLPVGLPYCHWDENSSYDMPPCEEEDYWAEARYEN